MYRQFTKVIYQDLINKTIGATDMTKPTHRKKRNKLAVALSAPMLAVVLLVGWSLSWIGQSRAPQPQKPTTKTQATQDSIELIMIPTPEEEQILAN
jgi:cytoskeletal protein RodZ